MNMRIFFGGPLTELKNKDATKHFYTHMADVAKKNNIECFWAFLNGTDPVKNPDVPSSHVYTTDLAQLQKSDVMISYIGEPTTGTGQEIEFARAQGIPVYLLYEKEKKISRMVKGSPNIKGSIIFTTHDEALQKLDELLEGLKQRFQQKGTLKEDFSLTKS